ncbi:dihydrolipoamide acetyltransferase family protein [Pseudarthrobacter sp. J1738]
MRREFRLPDLGEGLTESEILSWHVAPGDTVELNQIIAEVETAKAVVELPSPFAGVVLELHEPAGTVVEVGKPIVSFDVPDDGAAPDPSNGTGGAAISEGALEGEPKREPNLVGYGAVVDRGGRPSRRARAGVPATVTTAVTTHVAVTASPERPRSTPPVRKLAKDLGLDLTQLTGTGPSGLITRTDVQQCSARSEGSADSAGERETRTPIKGVRKHTAAAMVSSAFTAPHATEFLTIDVTATMELLARLKASKQYAQVRITPLTIVARALLVALKANPSLNSQWDEAAQEIVQFNYVNLGIAAATPRGLTVPNIKDAQDLTFLALAEELGELTQTARAGKTSPLNLSGGTISITNIGVFGIDAGTPILNPGEAAILAMGSVRKLPWEYQGEVALREVMTLSLSFDHRLVDGEQGSRFLADVGALLKDPALALTMG